MRAGTGDGASVAAMTAGPDLEPGEPPRRGHPDEVDRLDDRAGRAAPEDVLERVEAHRWPFCDAADAPVEPIRWRATPSR